MHARARWSWSAEFRRLCGFSSEAEFPDVVQSWSDRLHPDDVDKTFSAFLGALNGTAGSDKYDTTYRLKLKNGTYNWFRATGGVVRDKLGRPRRACGSLVDIQALVQERAGKDRRQAAMDQHTEIFGEAAAGVMQTLEASAGEMRSAGAELIDAVQRTRDSAEKTAIGADDSARQSGRGGSRGRADVQQRHRDQPAGRSRHHRDPGGGWPFHLDTEKAATLARTADKIGDVVQLVAKSPVRPICWRSMRQSKRRAPAMRARDSLSLQVR